MPPTPGLITAKPPQIMQGLIDTVSHPGAAVSHYQAPIPKQAPGANIDAIREGIGYNETRGVSGNPFSYYKSSGVAALGDALGKFQVTEGQLKQNGEKYLGRSITRNEFLSSPLAQNQYMNARIKDLTTQGYTPQQIADIHRSGMTNVSTPGSSVYQNPKYVSSFNQYFLKR